MENSKNWDLTEIYVGINSDEFKHDFDEYQKQLKQMNQWAEENLNGKFSANVVEEYINRKNLLENFSALNLYLQLNLSVDTSNSEMQRLMDKLENISGEAALHEALFLQYIKKAENLDFINTSEVLSNHRFYIEEQLQLALHTLSPEQELTIAQMKTTGSIAWQKLWEQESSNLEVSYENETLTLSQIRALADNKNAEIRKKAYEAEISAYKKIEVPVAFCLNSIKGEVLTLARKHGYKNPLEQVLQQSRIDKDILNAMLSAVKESLPYFRKYFDKKAEIMGDKDGLNFYNIFAPINNCSIEYTVEQAKSAVIDAFTAFNAQLGEFARHEFDNNHLDLLPKKGKVGGAFSEAVAARKTVRYLINFTGSFNDAITIAHELGHGYHSSRLFENSLLCSDYPMPIAETASTLCETIFINHILKDANTEQKIYILETDIQGAAQTLVDIYSRFLFEDTVFKHRQNGSLSVNELNEIMLESQKQTYGKLGCYHPYMWICKPHYYDADFNYYNFPYAFGMLLSKGLYSKYLQDKENFMPLYNKLLASTATANLADVAKIADIDLYSKDFWLSGVEIIKNDIEKLLQLLK